VLKGLASLYPALPATAALHALTVGAVGVLTLGMMARVALGHTGRPLEVHSAVVVAFVLVNAAAFVRSIGPMLAPVHYLVVLDVSATLWTIAFLTYAIVYLPILVRPRVDGKPG